MLKINELRDKLETIYEKEKRDIFSNYSKPNMLIRTKLKTNHLISSEYYTDIEKNVPDIYVEYENLDLLLKLYSKISANYKLKNFFINWITKYSIDYENNEPLEDNKITASLTFYFLFKIKRLNIAKEKIKFRYDKKYPANMLYYAIQNILRYEHHLISEIDIKYLEEIIDNLYNFRSTIIVTDKEIRNNQQTKTIRDLFNNLKIYRLKKELNEDINYEINQDKERIQKIIRNFGFDENISEALNKIEEAYFYSSENGFDIRNNISLLKEIFDKVIFSILNKLEKVTNEKPTKKNEKEHPSETKHKFICDKLLFSEGERKTLSSINKILNEEKHSLISKKEKFRITRNFTIELLLLMLSKLDNFIEIDKK